MPKCSICGSPHDTPEGVINHVQNTQDSDHKKHTDRGQIREECVEKIDIEAGGGGGSDPSPEGDQNPPEDTGGSGGGGEGNPTFDGGGPDPHEGDPTCPDCGGHTYFDASDHTDGEFDYGCGDCSDDESWVVWNE